MEYINAKDVLPNELFLQIQQYVGGSILYIPKKENEKKTWGTLTDSKVKIMTRNREIIDKKKHGATIEELMNEYYLSCDTIKSIIYRRK